MIIVIGCYRSVSDLNEMRINRNAILIGKLVHDFVEIQIRLKH